MANAASMLADPWFAALAEGKALRAIPRTMPNGAAKSIFLDFGIRSVLLVPITVAGEICGHVGLDDCTIEREMGNSVELDILQTVADMIGGAIIRERYVKKLKDANTIVEFRARPFYSVWMATLPCRSSTFPTT